MRYAVIFLFLSACSTPETNMALVRMTILEEFDKRDQEQWKREEARRKEEQEEADFNVRCDSRELERKIKKAEHR